MKPTRWFVMVVLLMATMAWAQAGPSAPLYQDEGAKPQAPSDEIVVPDARPVTGAQQLGLGFAEGKQNLLLTSFRCTLGVDSNIGLRPGNVSFGAVFNPAGQLALQRRSATSELVLSYNAGGSFYRKETAHPLLDGNTMFHQFGLTQSFSIRRWSVLLSDAFTYSPESAFGYFGAGMGVVPGGAGVGGANAVGLNPYLLPNQSVPTGRITQLSNTAVGQVQYNISRRTSVTVTGSYGVLHFPDNDLIDGRQYNLTTGYNRNLTSRDSVGVMYGFSSYSFEGTNTHMNNHLVELSYARRVTGRLSIKLGGGPQINSFDVPALSDMRVFGSAHAGATYRRGRNDLSLNYMHSLTGGSGVLTGAETDNLTAGLSRRFSRDWVGRLGFGYSRNSGLTALRDFNAEYGTISAYRHLGRYAGLYVSYSVQNESASGLCGLGCTDNAIRHLFTVGFDWRFRPIRLD